MLWRGRGWWSESQSSSGVKMLSQWARSPGMARGGMGRFWNFAFGAKTGGSRMAGMGRVLAGVKKGELRRTCLRWWWDGG
jgi:hypothetical protein